LSASWEIGKKSPRRQWLARPTPKPRRPEQAERTLPPAKKTRKSPKIEAMWNVDASLQVAPGVFPLPARGRDVS